MRLLNIQAEPHTLETKDPSNIPRYAILSHVWSKSPQGDDREIVFDDIANGATSYLDKRAWHKKVKGFCKEAKGQKFNFVWVDSCCIDKNNDRELSASLNSMYEWYQKAGVCFVHLADVVKPEHVEWLKNPSRSDDYKFKWFTRGWTLQELLAPQKVIFFDRHWNQIGTRRSLAEAIHMQTRIPLDLLIGKKNVRHYPVEERVRWSKGRETTRPEDKAYCLIGLLDISMIATYGIGKRKAWERLQQEVKSRLVIRYKLDDVVSVDLEERVSRNIREFREKAEADGSSSGLSRASSPVDSWATSDSDSSETFPVKAAKRSVSPSAEASERTGFWRSYVGIMTILCIISLVRYLLTLL